MKKNTGRAKQNVSKLEKSKNFKNKIYKEIKKLFNHKVVIDKRISESAKQI
ncbi:MAG: hypothetical protein H8E55_10870 [Pelagibacterales bacterium]|nr:hypothetical protein [Pelagibacterales bacterium]